jgi:hypothetical protein
VSIDTPSEPGWLVRRAELIRGPETSARCSVGPRLRLSVAAETYQFITHLTNWDLDAYQDWLVITGMRLTQAAERNS